MSESSGSAWVESSNGRRWLVSAAIVLLLHVCVAVAVLTWWKVTSTTPIEVDLSPSPSAPEQNASAPPAAEQNASEPAGAEQNKTEAASAGDHAAPKAPAPGNSGSTATSAQPTQEKNGTARDEAVAKAEQNTGPAEAPRGTTAPQLPSSPQGTEAESGAQGRTVNGGGILRAPSASGSGAGAATSIPGAGGPLPRPLPPMTPPAANPTTGPVATSPAVPGPGVPGPVANAPALNGITPSSPMARMPLDTSITVQPPVHGNPGVGPLARGEIGPLASRETGPFDHQPSVIFRPAKPFGVPDVPRNSLLPNSNPRLPGLSLNNAPGAHVQDRARAAMARAASRIEPVKNAIGSTVTSSAGGAVLGTAIPAGRAVSSNSATTLASRGDANEVNTGNGVNRNAIGVTANFRPRIPRANAGEATKTGAGVVASHGLPTAPMINGHDLGRPIAGPGTIGGPARGARAGVLSGSDFHLRH